MDENQALRHKLKNSEQEKLALKSLSMRAADEIDKLAETNCSQEAVLEAKAHADRLRRVVGDVGSAE